MTEDSPSGGFLHTGRGEKIFLAYFSRLWYLFIYT